jgi:acyl-[acyl-carrier-protein] desaturase
VVTRYAVSDAVDRAAGRLLERHYAMSREWFPHELVPWGSGRDPEPGWDGRPDPSTLPPGVLSALFVNLLTEDNLPHYFHSIASRFEPDSPIGEWTRRWTAEEQRHSIAIRDWICVTRQLNLVDLERARMQQVAGGFDTGIRSSSLGDGLVYLALQELATRVSHRNTGQMLTDPAGTAIMNRVAADENLHFLFYRDLVSAVLEESPSDVVLAIERQVREFAMPGTGIPNFTAHAAAIAAIGIYDYRVHYEQILTPLVLKHWQLEKIEGLSDDAERSRDATLLWIARVGRVARRMAQATGG